MQIWMVPVLLGITAGVTVQAQDLRDTAAAKMACGPKETNFDVDAVHRPGAVPTDPAKALVYVIEQESSTPAFCIGRCGGLTLKLGLDGRWRGALNGSSYTVLLVEPGEHHMCVNWQSHTKKLSEKVVLQSFTAEEGKTYYFITHDLASSPEAGSMASITLEATNPDEAKMLIEAYPQVRATPKK